MTGRTPEQILRTANEEVRALLRIQALDLYRRWARLVACDVASKDIYGTLPNRTGVDTGQLTRIGQRLASFVCELPGDTADYASTASLKSIDELERDIACCETLLDVLDHQETVGDLLALHPVEPPAESASARYTRLVKDTAAAALNRCGNELALTDYLDDSAYTIVTSKASDLDAEDLLYQSTHGISTLDAAHPTDLLFVCQAIAARSCGYGEAEKCMAFYAVRRDLYCAVRAQKPGRLAGGKALVAPVLWWTKRHNQETL